MSEVLKEFERYIDRRIVVGRIETVDEELGTIEVSYSSIEGFKTFNIPHPHFSASSWIRSMPEVGTYVLVGITQYQQFPEILKTFDPSERVRIALNHIREIKPNPDPNNPLEMAPVDRIIYASSPEGGLPFRKLRAGEHEVMSKGKSSLWISRRGYYLEKAGVARRSIDADQSKIQDWAAGHERLGMDATLQNVLWDSEYFGIVKRPSKDDTTIPLSELFNYSKVTEEIKANIHIEDRVTSKVQNLKSELEKSSKTYPVKLQELQTHCRTSITSLNSDKIETSTLENIVKNTLTKAESLDSNLDQVLSYMSQLKFIGAGFQYVQSDFNIAQSNLEAQKKFISLKCAQIQKVQFAEVKEILQILQSTTLVQIPIFNLEAQISKVFSAQTKQEASIAAKLEEVKSRSKIYLDKELRIAKKHAYHEPKLENKEFCKESRLTLSWKGKPGKLYEQVIGHVYDYLGEREKCPITNRNTRSRRTWWADQPNDTQMGVEWIDGDGNQIHFLAASAKKGLHRVVPEGHSLLDVGGDAELRTGRDSIERVAGGKKVLVVKDLVIEAENVIYKVRGKYQIDASQIILNQSSTSINKMTRPTQSLKASEYQDSKLIESSKVSSEKILVNEYPKRRFLEGNPLLGSRQKEIEDALTNVGGVQASTTLEGGILKTKATKYTIEAPVEITKTLKVVEAANLQNRDFMSHTHPKTGPVV